MYLVALAFIRESSKSTSKTVARDAERAHRRRLEEGFNEIDRLNRAILFSTAAKDYLEIKKPPRVDERADLGRIGNAVTAVHGQLQEAQRRLQSCGLHLPQPEGYGYFFGKTSGGAQRVQRAMFGDGHTSPKTEFMKSSEDDAFQFAFTWIEGGANKGWTTHYRPKRSPLPKMPAE